MGYRHRHDADERHYPGTVRRSFIAIDNGTISRISIPCFSRDNMVSPSHDRNAHDHDGWPEPDSIDDSCQLPPTYDRIIVMNEINLIDEGYDSIAVSLLDQPDGLTISGSIEGSFVCLLIVAMCQEAETVDLDVEFAVYAEGSTEDEDTGVVSNLRDVVTKGVLHIESGPIGDQEPWVTPSIVDNIRDEVISEVAPIIMKYSGIIRSESELLDRNLISGQYFIVGSDGTYAGTQCLMGDMIFINESGTYSTSEQLSEAVEVVQNNIESITNSEIDAIVFG